MSVGINGLTASAHDQAFQPLRELPAEIGDVSVIGSRHRDLERPVLEPDKLMNEPGIRKCTARVEIALEHLCGRTDMRVLPPGLPSLRSA
jgi:hypothetical protein